MEPVSERLTDQHRVRELVSVAASTKALDLFVLAPGFEERAISVVDEGTFKPDAYCILFRFDRLLTDNEKVFERYYRILRKKFSDGRILVVPLCQDAPQDFSRRFTEHLYNLPRSIITVGLDISGMPSHSVCLVLKCLRDWQPNASQLVFYTAALEYNPTEQEYHALIARSPDEIELLPRSMALEMDRTLVLDEFRGYQQGHNARTCLVVLAGHEAHRSNGVIEDINPALLLLVFGKPGDAHLDWRLDLSQRLHRKFLSSRRTATATVSTLFFEELTTVLDSYYNYLIDDYNLVIAPVSSKMQLIAVYLFWERYSEVQLTFPLPIGYNPAHAPIGRGKTYEVDLKPKNPLLRDPWIENR